MIPKIIHYCWFGGKKKPAVVQDCIKSWKKHLPDYEIIEWNEKNVDLSHPFLSKAYLDKKWAFVADFVRLEKLIEIGGVYLDTDMFLLKSLTELMQTPAFIGLESERYVSCGIIGAIPNHSYILKCYSFYDRLHLYDDFTYDSIIIPKIITKIYRERYHQNSYSLSPNIHEDLIVYPVEYFYPFPNKHLPLEKYKEYIKSSTFAVHLWNKSWKKSNALLEMKQGKFLKSFLTLIKEIITRDKNVDRKYLIKFIRALRNNLFNG